MGLDFVGLINGQYRLIASGGKCDVDCTVRVCKLLDLSVTCFTPRDLDALILYL